MRALKHHLVRRIAALVAVAASVCAVASCASSRGPKADGLGGKTVDYKVAVLSVGTSTDGSYGQAIAEGAANAAKSTGADVKFVGNLSTPDQYIAQATAFQQAGYDLIINANGGLSQVTITLAKRFPNGMFCQAGVPFGPGADKLPQNTCFFLPRAELGAFRAGALAGLATRSNVIGTNESESFSVLDLQINDFILGVHCVNPAARVLTALTNTDSDPAPTKTASEAQIAQGADVLFGATGTAMSGVFQAAAEHRGVYAIGQYVDAAATAPNVVLASAIPNLQQAIPYVITQAMNRHVPQVQTLGIDLPFTVGALTFNPALRATLSKSAAARYALVDQAVSTGKITVPDLTTAAGRPRGWTKFDVAKLGCTPTEGPGQTHS